MLCLDPARLNQALIRPESRRSTINDIVPRPANVKHLTLMDASFRYHNLERDEKLTYLTTFQADLISSDMLQFYLGYPS